MNLRNIFPLVLCSVVFLHEPPRSLGADGRSIELLVKTKALAEGAEVATEVEAIKTLGYHEPGRGAGLYVYSGNSIPQYSPRGQSKTNRPASHYIATKSGGRSRYYVLAEASPNVLQFGAVAGTGKRGSFDNTDAFNDALSYGQGVSAPAGRFYIAGTIFILEDGTLLSGVGPGGADQGGTELVFGPGTADCIQAGDGRNQLRWCKLTRLAIDAGQRTGGNAVFAFFNYQLALDELRITQPYNGIQLFRGMGFMIKNIMMSGIRAGSGSAKGPTEIGYGIKFGGAPELYQSDTGKKIKRDTQVLYVENLSFGSQKVETDPSNWTVGLWCAENAASVNGATLKNQNVRHGIYITRASSVDQADKLSVPPGYRLVPATWTDTSGTKGRAGEVYTYGSSQYPTEPGTVVDLNGRFQDLTLFYVGGDYLGGEYIFNDEGAGVAIYNPHFMRSYQGNCVYMGPRSRDMSIYGGQTIGAFKNGFEMHGERWHISGVQIYRHSLDSANRAAHSGRYSAIKVGKSSVGGDILNCKIGNEPLGTTGRAGSTVKFGVDIEAGASRTSIQGNRFDGCLDDNITNRAAVQAQNGR